MHANAPYYLFSFTNAVQVIYYENGELVSANFSEPPVSTNTAPCAPH